MVIVKEKVRVGKLKTFVRGITWVILVLLLVTDQVSGKSKSNKSKDCEAWLMDCMTTRSMSLREAKKNARGSCKSYNEHCTRQYIGSQNRALGKGPKIPIATFQMGMDE